MIIKVESENKKLLDILGKNPDSFNGIQLREHKNGVAIARIVSPLEYHLVFQDTKYSYSEDTSSQIDFQSYCNPRAALGLLTLFLRDELGDINKWNNKLIPWANNKTRAELDNSEFKTTVTVENVYIDGMNINRGFVMEKYFPGIVTVKISDYQYKLIVTGNSIFQVINLTAIALLYIGVTNKQSWYINDDMVEKYVRIVENVGSIPYFILYILTGVIMPTKTLFDKYKIRFEKLFEFHTGLSINIKFGNTQMQRVRHISELLIDNEKIRTNIVEVGCGEGEYPKKMARYMDDDLKWWSVDIEDHSYLNNDNKVMTSKSSEFEFVKTQNDIPKMDNLTILMVEVIEHMPIEFATNLILDAIANHNPNRIIVTTPNKTFNKWYEFDSEDREFRHDDHCFELTTQEFKSYIKDVISDKKYTIQFFGIGDCIDGEYVSIGAELIKYE